MRSKLRRILALLTILCALPAVSLAGSACTWTASVRISVSSDTPVVQAVIDLLNALHVSGTWAERDGAFDLTARVGIRDTDAAAELQLGGVASHWQLRSPLLGNQVLMFNNPAMIEFGNKINNHLGLPLQYAALLYPYAWEDGLAAPLEAVREVIGTGPGERIVPLEECVALAERLADLAENDRAFSNLLTALTFGDEGWSAADVVTGYLWELPWMLETWAPDGLLVQRTESGLRLYLLNGEVRVPILEREGGRVVFALPDGSLRYESDRSAGGGHTLVTLGPDGEELRLEVTETEDRLTVSLSGTAFGSASFPVFGTGSDGRTVMEMEPLEDRVFSLEILHEDTCYILRDPVSGCEIGTLFLETAETEPARWPDWTAATVTGINFYSLDDSTLADLVRSIAVPMAKGLVPLIAAAPTASVTALMDWLEGSGLLDAH